MAAVDKGGLRWGPLSRDYLANLNEELRENGRLHPLPLEVSE